MDLLGLTAPSCFKTGLPRDRSDGTHAVRALLPIAMLVLMLPTSTCFCFIMCGQALDSTSRAPRDGNPLHMSSSGSGWTCLVSQHLAAARQDYPGIALMALMLSGHFCSPPCSCSCFLPQHAFASSCAGKLWTPHLEPLVMATPCICPPRAVDGPSWSHST
jgi:hypothetical protein